MMDYKELVKCLRMCHSTGNDLECDCDHCLFRDKIIDGGSWADYTECTSAMGLATADAIEELLRAAKKMHTWIFLNTGDEQKAYDECGLSDEMNAALGYGGRFEIKADPCADCVHYPPSSTDGKPCCACDPANPLTNCHEAKEET